MNLIPSVFWNMTFREFILAQRGYLERLEDEQIHDWNLLRNMATYILQPHLKKGKTIKPTEIMHLPIDGKSRGKIDVEKRRKAAILAAKKVEKLEEKNKNKPKKVIGIESLMIKKS